METRLNKFLAHAGVCSRREADRLIVEGRVRVNGRVVQELGAKIDASRDRVVADGRTVRPESERTLFVLLNKPAGPVVSVKDPFGRPTVMDLLPKLETRVYPVGRLDAETEGALLLTSDGETAHRLTHPRYEVPKVYEALVEGQAAEEALERVRKGIFLEGRRTAPAKVRALRRGSDWTLVGLEIHEGRKREIRKLLEAVGHRVKKLRRVAFAGLTLEGLKPGQWRYLKKTEIDRLRSLAARPSPRRPSR